MSTDTGTGRMEELVRKWQAGDRSAGDLLFQKHYPELLVFARRLFPRPLRSRADTVDLVQDTFAAACESHRRFQYQGTRSFARWLHAILEHRLWKRWRTEKAKQRDIARERQVADSALLSRPQQTPSENLSLKEDVGKLESAVESLSPEHKRVVKARYLEQKSWDEISRDVGKSKEASQMLLVRALKKLRRFFGS